MKAFKMCSAVIITALILNGCSAASSPGGQTGATPIGAVPVATPATGATPTVVTSNPTGSHEVSNVKYLFTLQSPQGETPLGPQSKPSPQEPLTLHLATDQQPAKVVVATFQDGALTLSPSPVMVSVDASSERTVDWKVPEGEGTSKIFTAFMPAEGEASGEMEQLLAQCTKQADGHGPAAQRLYDRLSEWAGEDRTGSQSAGHEVVELGAALSTSLMNPETQKPAMEQANGGAVYDAAPQAPTANAKARPAVAFDWRQSARQASFAADRHCVVITDFATSR